MIDINRLEIDRKYWDSVAPKNALHYVGATDVSYAFWAGREIQTGERVVWRKFAGTELKSALVRVEDWLIDNSINRPEPNPLLELFEEMLKSIGGNSETNVESIKSRMDEFSELVGRALGDLHRDIGAEWKIEISPKYKSQKSEGGIEEHRYVGLAVQANRN